MGFAWEVVVELKDACRYCKANNSPPTMRIWAHTHGARCLYEPVSIACLGAEKQ